jgi:hypothetical protein
VRAARGETDEHVACRRTRAVDDRVLLDETDAEAGEIVIVARVHAGHLGRFAADERTARLHAAFDDALDDTFRRGDAELACGVVIEKEQGLGALDDDVVRAHRDQVDADRVVAPGFDRQPELGADAVGSGHHDRTPIALERHLDEGTEAADAGEHLGPARTRDRRFDALDELVSGVDIDARIAICR